MLVEELDEEAISLRYKDLCYQAEYFKKLNNQTYPFEIEYDKGLFYMVNKSACDDINRYKNYHAYDENMRLNAVKRASFFTKWIIKFKPFYVKNRKDLPAEKDLSLLTNESFAIYFSETNLTEDVGKQVALTPNIQETFLYSLLYRNLNEDSLLLFYQAVFDEASGRPILQK